MQPSQQSKQTVDGIEVHIEGTGDHTIVMLHGWPDSYRLWDSTVAQLKDRWRCVRFSLPGFDGTPPERGLSLADMTARIAAVVEAVSPNAPVTLLIHDWGCTFGYEYAARHPHKVARIAAVDIGDHNTGAYMRSLTPGAKWAIFKYQYWLACAWYAGVYLGSGVGNALTRFMARKLRCPTPSEDLQWQKNFPYAMLWMKLHGGLRGCIRVKPACPVLFIYGQRKPYMFHSPQWLESLAQREGCQTAPFATGHWVMVEQPQAFADCVAQWLEAAPAAAA